METRAARFIIEPHTLIEENMPGSATAKAAPIGPYDKSLKI
jgi:hypothetical protein